MVGNQDDNSESPSSAPGIISLEQAGTLALRYACDNLEFYGRYAEQELAWDIVSADETGDRYEVRLSYRPLGTFHTAGIEQFEIAKTGSIVSRQIIRQPRLTHRFIAASVAMVLVMVAGAVFAGLSATDVQEAAEVPATLDTSVSIEQNESTHLIAPEGQVIINQAANIVSTPAQIAYAAVPDVDVPALPGNFGVTGSVFELTSEAPLLAPITITVAFSASDIALAGRNEANIVIQHHTGGAWIRLATEVDFNSSTAKAEVDHLSMFALTIWVPGPTPAPEPKASPTVTPEPTLAPTKIPAVVALPTAVPAPVAAAPQLPTPVATPLPVPVPTAQPMPVKAPTPVPFDTPAPELEWHLEDVLVAADRVTVMVRMLGPSKFDITLDGETTEETILDGSLRADIFRNVPPGSHMVRVFTIDDPDLDAIQSLKVMHPTPTMTPTPTPSGPPTATPIPRYRIFVNGVQVPGLNRLMYTDAGTVTISRAPESDGAYKVGVEVVLVAGAPSGFIVDWGGVDSQRGAFATIEMVADRHIAVRMAAPTPTPEPTRTPFPWDIPTAIPPPTPIPVPIPVPTATGVLISALADGDPTPTPVPTATPTPLPPGAPTLTPTPTPTPGPSPTPGPTYTLTAEANPLEGGTLSPAGTTTHNAGTQVTVTQSPSSGFIFSSWSGACSGDGSCLVTMNASQEVTGNFTQVFALTTSASPSEGGTVSPNGSNSYVVGTLVPVTATAAAGYNFSSWSGDCTGTGSCAVTMDAAKNVVAVFVVDSTPTATPAPTTTPVPAATGKIVFASTRDDSDPEIYVMNADGSNVTRLTTNDYGNMYPSWSPDGSKIAWSSNRGNWDIFVMNADGSGETQLTTDGNQDRQPTWSPDGSKIAFQTPRDMDQTAINELYVMNADGSGQTRLTDITSICVNTSNCSVWEPAWSPDGSKIAFRSAHGGDAEIYVVDSDGTNQVNLTNNSASDIGPSWSPDGTKIIFSSNRDGNSEIYLMNADGSGQARLTNNSDNDSAPVWSTDGSRIAFSSNREGDWEIFTMNADGTTQVNLTSNNTWDEQSDWGP